jgi:hypothetical protein
VAGVVGASREGEKREGKRESEGERQQTAEASRPRAQAEADEKSERGLSLRQRQSRPDPRAPAVPVTTPNPSAAATPLASPWSSPCICPAPSPSPPLSLPPCCCWARGRPMMQRLHSRLPRPTEPRPVIPVSCVMSMHLSTPECSCHGSPCMAGKVHPHLLPAR